MSPSRLIPDNNYDINGKLNVRVVLYILGSEMRYDPAFRAGKVLGKTIVYKNAILKPICNRKGKT